MNINQLKYVVEVANSSSIREASNKLFISQPALSASIHELEDELSILLFERSNKGIIPTDAGYEFIEYAKRVLSQYEILEDHYLSKDKDKEKFSVSTQHYNFAIVSFTEVIKKFDPKQFVFSIHETRTNEVLENVRDLKSEVGVISYSHANETIMKKLLKDYNLEFEPLFTRDTYAYVWKNHKFANRKEISLEELRAYPCIFFNQDNDSNFYITEEALGDYDYDKLIRSDDRATTMELIAKLDGYSIGSGMLADENAVLQGMVSIKLKEEDPLLIGYIVRKNGLLSKYGQSYVEELLKYKEI